MCLHKTARAGALVAVLPLAFASIAAASITHPSGDGASFARPPAAVTGRFQTNASLIAIGPNHAITTRHQGGGVGSTVTFDGQSYVVAEQINHPQADLRVLRIAPAGGGRADLNDFVEPFGGLTELGQIAVITGWGRGRGGDILGGPGGMQTVGYQWSSTFGFGEGQNLIEGTDTSVIFGFTSDLVLADFDSPTLGVTAEATVAEGDSGGGWFLNTGGTWRVAGLHIGVENASQAIFSPPELMVGLRVSSYTAFIDDSVAAMPAPGCSVADVTTTGATLPGQPGYGVPDGVVDLDDLGYFLSFWLDADAGVADLTTTAGQPGFGVPDGFVGIDDLGYFLNFWSEGCP